jgi:hypothetical protein
MLLALAAEPVDLKKEPEPTATLPARGGAANGLIEVARLTKARQQGDGNPSRLVKSKATIATSLSKFDAAPSDADARRHGAARRAARGGKSGVSRFVVQGRGDQRRQRDTLAGKATGTRLVSVFDGGEVVGAVGWRWPAGGQQLAASRCTSWSVRRTGCLGADAGLARWGNPSGNPFDGVWSALDGVETYVAAALHGTSRSSWQAQLTASVGCWTRRLPIWRQWGHRSGHAGCRQRRLAGCDGES